MPKCGLKLDGVVAEWGVALGLVTRLTKTGRLIEAPEGFELKPGNKVVAHNHEILRPVLTRMAEHADWELFSLPEVKKKLTALRRSFGIKIDKDAIHMDGLWTKNFASFVKMKDSPEEDPGDEDMDADDDDDDDEDGADGEPAAEGSGHPAEPSEYGPDMEVEDVGSVEELDGDACSEADGSHEIVPLNDSHMGARAPSRKAIAIALSDEEEATAAGAAEDRVHEFNANLVRLPRLQELKDQMESTRRELESKMLD
ncbi:unnamed protein product [Symbiodinium sp. CCMP2592]|nr:unnamed protein product [Symbiodinium sp. CCMP2592]